MSDLIPILLAACIAALLLLGIVDVFATAIPRRALACATACIAGGGMVLAMLAVAIALPATTLAVPIGPPGSALLLRLDALSGYCLTLLLLPGTALLTQAAARAELPALPSMLLAGLSWAVLAGDGLTLALGFCVVGIALWRSAEVAGPQPVFVIVAGLSLMVAWRLGELPSASAWSSVVRLILAWIGGGLCLRLVPLPWWPAFGRPELPRSAAAILAALLPVVGVYMVVRLAPEAGFPADASIWGGALVLIGSVACVWCALTSEQAMALDEAVALAVARPSGMCLIALGMGGIADSADMPSVAFGFRAALLALLAGQSICGTLAVLGARAAIDSAGSRRIDRMGGLLNQTPVMSATLAIGLLGLVAIPPTIGFFGAWALVQAIVVAPRTGAAWPDGLLLVALVALAVSAALALGGAVRLCATALLGRPRTPRGSAAEDVARAEWPALGGLALCATLLGLFPNAMTWFGSAATAASGTASPAVRIDDPMGFATSIALLLVLGLAIPILRVSRRGEETGPPTTVWSGGFSPPPAWLPFGDPVTQTGGLGFVPTLPVVSWRTWFSASIPFRRWLLLGAMVALLGIAGLFG